MRYLIFSDIQGNLKAMSDFVRGIEGFNRDCSFCLGDIINNGLSYDENRVVDSLRGISDVVVIKGNHDDVRPSEEVKISPENLDFLNRLPDSKRHGSFFLFHSSTRSPGFRLLNSDDFSREYAFINQQARFFLYGHTHQKSVFTLGDSTTMVHARTISLNQEQPVFINPGGLGLYYGQPQSFAVLDDTVGKLRFYSLDELRSMDTDRRALNLFQDNIVSYLKGDVWTAQNFFREASLLESLSGEKFSEIITLLRNYSLPKDKKSGKKYLNKFKNNLADVFSSFYSQDIHDNYSIIHPHKLV